MRKYEVSHICAAVVATVGILGVVVVVSASLTLTWTERTTFQTQGSRADWILAGCAIVGVLTSFIGLILLGSTLRANRRMAEVAFQGIEDTIWLRQNEKRPTLKLDSIGFQKEVNPSNGFFTLYCKIENFCQSEVRDVKVDVKIERFDTYVDVRTHLQKLYSSKTNLNAAVDIARMRPVDERGIRKLFSDPAHGWNMAYAIFAIEYDYRYASKRCAKYYYFFAVDLSAVNDMEQYYIDTPDGPEWYISGNLELLFGHDFHD